MIQVEPIQNLDGFGTGKTATESIFSQGMLKSQFGVSPKMSIIKATDSSTLTNLSILNWMAQGHFSSDYVYGVGTDGRLFKTSVGSTVWTEERNPGSSHGNGLIFDQKNRLLYARDQYLGMTSDGSSFNDSWQDFTVTYSTTDYRPMDTFEDWVVIGNKNAVAVLNVTDDSFNTEALTLPSGANVRCLKSGKNGILIGANFNNRGALILWTPDYIRSIAPWIWRNKQIRSIIATDDGWIVFTQNEILLTNGYSVQTILADFPDYLYNDIGYSDGLSPQGAELQGDYLVFWGSGSHFNRQKSGLYRLNLNTKLLEFIPVSSGVTHNGTGGAIITDSQYLVHLSYKDDNPSKKYLGVLSNNPGSENYIITYQGQGENEKVAEGIKVTLVVPSFQSGVPAMTADVSVKIANNHRHLFGRAVTRAASVSTNILKIDGSIATANRINKAQVGDEVTFLDGVNAGLVRHITAIANQGTNTEEWTLDSTLPNNTGSGDVMNVSPFKFVDKYSLSDVSELKELYFDIQNRIKGKKFYVKILLENLPTAFMPELRGGQFIYDDLGVKR